MTAHKRPESPRVRRLLTVSGALTLFCGVALKLAGGVHWLIPLVLVVGGTVVGGGALALRTGAADDQTE